MGNAEGLQTDGSSSVGSTTDHSPVNSAQQATSAAFSQPLPTPVPAAPPPPQPMAVTVGTRDARGIERGRCTKCPSCTVYTPQVLQDEYGRPITASLRCMACSCPPRAHENLSKRQNPSQLHPMHPYTDLTAVPVSNTANMVDGFVMVPDNIPPTSIIPNSRICAVPHCGQSVEFDPNTGAEFAYCSGHIHASPTAYATHATDLRVEDVEYQDPTSVQYLRPQPPVPAADMNGWQQCKCMLGFLPPCRVVPSPQS